MNKIKAEINGHNLELWYHSTLGVLEAVYEDGKPLIVETMYSGVGFSVRNETGPLSSMNVCDARYAYVRAVQAFVPRLLFVEHREPVPTDADKKLETML